MHHCSWTLSATFLFLLAEVAKCYPVNNLFHSDEHNARSLGHSKFLKEFTDNNHASKSERQKRDDEDNDLDLPEIVPEILKIVGSALAGNATAFLDNSISLLPEGVGNTISGALNVLVNTITNAQPTKRTTLPPKTTTKTVVKAVTSDDLVTTQSTTSTTDEDEEEEEEEKTTNANNLGTNSSSNANSSTAESVLGQLSTFNLTGAGANESSQYIVTPITVMRVTSDLEENINSNVNTITSALDLDNKANWISLIGPLNGSHASSSVVVDDTDKDNKANWASLLSSPVSSSVQLAPVINQKPLETPNSFQGAPDKSAVIHALGQTGDKNAADIVASILKLNREEILSKMRDNSKAPGNKILSPTQPNIPSILNSGDPSVHVQDLKTQNNKDETVQVTQPTITSLREKLMTLLEAQSSNTTSFTGDLTSQLLQVIQEHTRTSNENQVKNISKQAAIIKSNSSNINITGLPLYGQSYASGFIHSNAITLTTATTLSSLTDTFPSTTEEEDEDEDEDSRK